MKTKKVTWSTPIIGACAGAVLLMTGPAHAQNVFVGDYASESIIEYSGGTHSTFATGLDYPTGLAFDGSGDLFEADQFSGHIYEWVGAGKTRTTFASGLIQPGPMTFNAAGDLFVNVNGNIDEFSPAGVVINTITGFSGASGLTFDSAGNLYVSNVNGGAAGAGSITEITPKGARSTFASGLNYPFGLAFNAAGDLFVANANGFNTVTEITPGGSQSVFASGLEGSTDVAFDTAGDLFVADAGYEVANGDLTEFAANGTKSVLASGLSAESVAIQPVPEPSVFGLIGAGAAILLCCRRAARKVTAKA